VSFSGVAELFAYHRPSGFDSAGSLWPDWTLPSGAHAIAAIVFAFIAQVYCHANAEAISWCEFSVPVFVYG
jgi:hypothetical protein